MSRPPFNKPSAVPKEFAWPSLLARDGDELETHYRHVLESLGKQKGGFHHSNTCPGDGKISPVWQSEIPR